MSPCTRTNTSKDIYLTWEWLVRKYAVPSLPGNATAFQSSQMWCYCPKAQPRVFRFLIFINSEGTVLQFPFLRLVTTSSLFLQFFFAKCLFKNVVHFSTGLFVFFSLICKNSSLLKTFLNPHLRICLLIIQRERKGRGREREKH